MNTTTMFLNYLKSLGLFRLKIWVDYTGVNAIVNSKPPPERFTQVKQLDPYRYQVRLSFKDFDNDSITGGFFSYESHLK